MYYLHQCFWRTGNPKPKLDLNIPRLEEESGEFILSAYGNGHAVLCRGDDAFRARCRCLFENHKPDKSRAAFLDYDDRTSYMTTSKDGFRNLLKRYYYGVVALSKEIPDLSEDVYDEVAMEKRAEEKADSFIAGRLKVQPFLNLRYCPDIIEFRHSQWGVRNFHGNSDENEH